MKTTKLFFFLSLITVTSCKQKEFCIYTEEEHKLKLNEKIRYKIYQGEKDKNWTYYDEADSSGRGNCYIFKDGILDGFTFHYSKEEPCYMERSKGNGDFNQITTKPLLDFYFCENKNSQIHLYLIFTTIKTTVNQVKIYNDEGKSNILHIEKDSAKTNEYFCKVFLSKQDSNSIKKAKYYIEYTTTNCKGQKFIFNDTVQTNNK